MVMGSGLCASGAPHDSVDARISASGAESEIQAGRQAGRQAEQAQLDWTNWTLAALAGEPQTCSVGNGPERRSRQPPGPWGSNAFS